MIRTRVRLNSNAVVRTVRKTAGYERYGIKMRDSKGHGEPLYGMHGIHREFNGV